MFLCEMWDSKISSPYQLSIATQTSECSLYNKPPTLTPELVNRNGSAWRIHVIHQAWVYMVVSVETAASLNSLHDWPPMIPINYSSPPEGNKLELSPGLYTLQVRVLWSVLFTCQSCCSLLNLICEWTIPHTSKVINIASMEIPSHDVKLKADMKV